MLLVAEISGADLFKKHAHKMRLQCATNIKHTCKPCSSLAASALKAHQNGDENFPSGKVHVCGRALARATMHAALQHNDTSFQINTCIQTRYHGRTRLPRQYDVKQMKGDTAAGTRTTASVVSLVEAPVYYLKGIR